MRKLAWPRPWAKFINPHQAQHHQQPQHHAHQNPLPPTYGIGSMICSNDDLAEALDISICLPIVATTFDVFCPGLRPSAILLQIPRRPVQFNVLLRWLRFACQFACLSAGIAMANRFLKCIQTSKLCCREASHSLEVFLACEFQLHAVFLFENCPASINDKPNGNFWASIGAAISGANWAIIMPQAKDTGMQTHSSTTFVPGKVADAWHP